jgi:F-type H+-transporting ATPase subunit delta
MRPLPGNPNYIPLSIAEAARQRTVFDVDEQRIGKVYSDALLNAAQQQGKADEVLAELRALVQDVFQREPYVEAMLSSAALGRDRKAEMIRTAFEGRCSDLLFNFLLVLNGHDRLDLIRSVLASYEVRYGARSGQVFALVKTAVPLPDDQREVIVHRIRDYFQREPVLATEVDPDLLGGLVIKMGDWTFDASVHTRLNQIREQLIERSSHEIQSRRDHFSSH